MIEANIWSALQEAGFSCEVSIEPYRIRFDAEKLLRTQTFKKKGLDFPLEKLTVRRQAARFGWINKPE
jgi:hypothetical protein